MLNGATKAVLYQSTSSSRVFNYLLGSSGVASSGNTVYIESGAYTVDATWGIYVSDVTVTFQSGAVLTAVNDMPNMWGQTGVGSPVMWLYGNNIIVSGVTINGNGLNQAVSATTYLSGANYCAGIMFNGNNSLVEYSTIYNCRSYGTITGDGVTTNNNGVMNCLIYDCGANGLNAWSGDNGSYFINNNVYDCGDVGIDSYGLNTIITGNTVYNVGWTTTGQTAIYGTMYGYNNAGWGIAIEESSGQSPAAGGSGSGNYLFIAGNTVSTTSFGIVVDGSGNGNINYVLISGNSVTTTLYWGLRLRDTSYDIVEYNTITTASIGVYLAVNTGSCTSNTVYGMTYSGCSTNYNYNGLTVSSSAPSIVAVTVASSPTGVGFVTANGSYGYAGAYSTSPYIFYDTVGNSVTLVANTVSGYTFSSWSDSGAQSHTITVPSSDATYTATFT